LHYWLSMLNIVLLELCPMGSSFSVHSFGARPRRARRRKQVRHVLVVHKSTSRRFSGCFEQVWYLFWSILPLRYYQCLARISASCVVVRFAFIFKATLLAPDMAHESCWSRTQTHAHSFPPPNVSPDRSALCQQHCGPVATIRRV
jgi:hypothetical protein